VYASGVGGSWRRQFLTGSWIDQTAAGSRSWTNIASSSYGTKLAAGAYGNFIYISTDSGATKLAEFDQHCLVYRRQQAHGRCKNGDNWRELDRQDRSGLEELGCIE
jgi:hypothetical protein